ncbi:hypothetical protein QJS10_CPA03g01192 [Acorus calamus]|uniref:Uncharacterized protein n=1 Tax=Acorus calamus TaxID=4465 RepID=A0AAV9F527_ACOCL|nr:hypothetical protein QJS10_CPA03g01192 [Acorus calamus]
MIQHPTRQHKKVKNKQIFTNGQHPQVPHNHSILYLLLFQPTHPLLLPTTTFTTTTKTTSTQRIPNWVPLPTHLTTSHPSLSQTTPPSPTNSPILSLAHSEPELNSVPSSSSSSSSSSKTASITVRGDHLPRTIKSTARNGCSKSISHVHLSLPSLRRHFSIKSLPTSDNAAVVGRPSPYPISTNDTSHGAFPPVAISITVHPSDQTSDAGIGDSPRTTSGAIHNGVPHNPPARAPSATRVADPKSASLAEFGFAPARTFRAFTSQWTTPAACASRGASATRRTYARTSASSIGDFAAASATVPPGTYSMRRFRSPKRTSSPR